jgi:hypothetical protein
MTGARAGALAVPSTPMFSRERRRLLDLAAKNRLPAMFTFRDYADAGGLMSYGPNLADLCRRAATYVDKILKGSKPGDLPVESRRVRGDQSSDCQRTRAHHSPNGASAGGRSYSLASEASPRLAKVRLADRRQAAMAFRITVRAHGPTDPGRSGARPPVPPC